MVRTTGILEGKCSGRCNKMRCTKVRLLTISSVHSTEIRGVLWLAIGESPIERCHYKDIEFLLRKPSPVLESQQLFGDTVTVHPKYPAQFIRCVINDAADVCTLEHYVHRISRRGL